MMHIMEIDIPKDEDERESFLASYAVYWQIRKHGHWDYLDII